MTNRQFDVLSQLHKHYREAFDALPERIRNAFYVRLGRIKLLGK